jgi:SAGA-associated factor 73
MSSKDSLVGASGYKFGKPEKKAGRVKLRFPAPVKAKGSLWSNARLSNCKTDHPSLIDSKSATSKAPSPVLPQFDDETMANFPNGKQEPLDTLVCKLCKKSMLKRTAKEHIALCLKSKQDKARKKKEAREAAQRAKEKAEKPDDDEDDDDDDPKGGRGARKSAVNGDDDGTKKGKKRKADPADDDKDSKKKKKKEEPKPKAAKPKGPVDVEKQCGVALPNGAQCARSLTCKSHSMGAKRAVPGRSLPYDMLLAAYQKKNQARQQSEWIFVFLIYISNTRPCRSRHRRQRARFAG